ncbi:MAG: minor capsid protein [Alkalibacterium sp.]|nr:minor capsid protein [Alkalibacterium sp.]
MSNYWKKRNEEMEHIQSMYNSDAEYNKAIKDIYQRAEKNILKEIDSELMRYAGRENLSMDEARKKVSKMDVEAFRGKAKQYVKEKNFTARANDELRAYNVKMRMNRLQMLQENIRLETIALADEESKLLHSRLDEEIWDELSRQAGILGETIPSKKAMRKNVRAIVEADFKGTDFSNRIWRNQNDLQRRLSKTIEDVLIQGKNPREGARDIRGAVSKRFKNANCAADRIAITESGRVQIASQKLAYKEFDIEQLEIIVEPDGCDECQPHDGNIVNVNDAREGENVPVFHPFCRCSTTAYVDRKAYERDLTNRGL